MKRQRVFLVLTVLWLAVIWGHSMMPASESKAESGGIVALLVQYLPWVTDRLVRKAAHFTEYAVLGALLFGAFPQRGRTAVIQSVFAGFLVALLDETIQLFAPGRSGQITDVWLDMAGWSLPQLLLRLRHLRK
ncbi:MAG: VanZ family protein [Oscillospiraceae bacterium]|nr:VanZ family protein [Oscillospiraceae bacterium]